MDTEAQKCKKMMKNGRIRGLNGLTSAEKKLSWVLAAIYHTNPLFGESELCETHFAMKINVLFCIICRYFTQR